jgi:hypothetical protein
MRPCPVAFKSSARRSTRGEAGKRCELGAARIPASPVIAAATLLMLRPADALHGGGMDPELSGNLAHQVALADSCASLLLPKWTTHPLFLQSQIFGPYVRALSGAVSMSGAGNRARARARIHVSIERMVGNWLTAAAIKPS